MSTVFFIKMKINQTVHFTIHSIHKFNNLSLSHHKQGNCFYFCISHTMFIVLSMQPLDI